MSDQTRVVVDALPCVGDETPGPLVRKPDAKSGASPAKIARRPSRGTVTPPKPPSARQVRTVFGAYEAAMNAIVELTKRFAPESLPGIEGRWIRESAFQLQGQLAALLRFVEDEENERR